MSEYDINRHLAEQICRGEQWNGRQFRQGEWVALLDGKVVESAPDPDSALRALRALDPDPRRGMVVEVAPPVLDVIR